MSSSMTLAIMLMLKDMASSPLSDFQKKVSKLSNELTSVGATAQVMGNAILNGLKVPIAQFADAEDAATQLRVSMMNSQGISQGFEKVNKLAVELGNKLPGTTADFQQMMTALNQQGVKADSILNGVGKSAAYLGVQLKMPFREAAIFAAKVGEAAGVAAGDMEKFMDVIQRTANLGVETTEMQYAFGRSAGALKSVGMQGLESAQSLSIMYSQLIKAGLSGETVGTNFAGMLENFKKYEYGIGDKAKSAKSSLKALGIEMDFFDKKGNLRGTRETIKELEKLKKLAPDVKAKVMDSLFGGGQDLQMANTLIDGGVAAFDKQEAELKKQASLQKKVEEQLKTLKNVWDAASGTFMNLMAALGESIAPELKAMADGFGQLSAKIQDFAKAHPGITKLAVGLTLLSGVGLTGIGAGLMGAGFAARFIAHPATLAGVSMLSTRMYGVASAGLKVVPAMKAWNASTGAWIVANTKAAGGAIVRMPKLIWDKAKAMAAASQGAIPRLVTQMKAWTVANAAAASGGLKSLAGLIKSKASALWQATAANLAYVKSNPIAALKALGAAAFGRIAAGFRAVAMSIRAMGLAALSNPVLWIAIAIAGAALIIYKYWRPISAFFKGVFNGLRIGLAPLKPAFDATFKALAPVLNPVISALKGLWNLLKNLLKPVDDVGNRGQKMGLQFGMAIAGMIKKGAELLSALTGVAGKFLGIGANMAQGLIRGFMSIPIVSTIVGKVKEMISAVMGAAQVKSPSRVFMYIGSMLGSGLTVGMDAQTDNIFKSAKRMVKAATPAFPKINAPGFSLQAKSLPPVPSRSPSGAGSGGLLAQGGQIVFSPTIQVTVANGASAREQINQAMNDSYAEFKRMIQRHESDKRRVNA